MPKTKKIKCPACDGTGKIEVKYMLIVNPDTIGEVALKLREAGLSYREIAKQMQISHPFLVKYHIDKYKKFVNSK